MISLIDGGRRRARRNTYFRDQIDRRADVRSLPLSFAADLPCFAVPIDECEDCSKYRVTPNRGMNCSAEGEWRRLDRAKPCSVSSLLLHSFSICTPLFTRKSNWAKLRSAAANLESVLLCHQKMISHSHRGNNSSR